METEEQKATNYETLRHIEKVRNYLNMVIKELLERGEEHDQEKMKDPELSLFVEYTPKLAAVTYGSEEYSKLLAGLKPALDHHYAKYRHHPEHTVNGINDMTLIDLIEMFCDWKAASERHNDGNILKSIEYNKKRFGIDAQLTQILNNTAVMFDK